MDKFISVIITAYNETKNIEYTLKIFDEMYNPEMPFEVIVVEDGSDTVTREVCSKEYKFPVTYLWHQDAGFRCAYSKNRGIKEAQGSHIFILDGDSFPSKTLIEEYWPLIGKASDTVCLYGWRHIVRKDYSTEGSNKSILEKDIRGELKNIPSGSYALFSGANVMIPADLAKKIEWAPDDWVGYGYDDYYFCLNWILNGGILAPVDIVTYHADGELRDSSKITKERFKKFKKRVAKEYYGEI